MMNVELTDAGKAWFQENSPQGIPYRIPHRADGKPTIKKALARKGGLRS